MSETTPVRLPDNNHRVHRRIIMRSPSGDELCWDVVTDAAGLRTEAKSLQDRVPTVLRMGVPNSRGAGAEGADIVPGSALEVPTP